MKCFTKAAGLRWLFLALVLASGIWRGLAADNLSAQYGIDIWKTQQGLPQNTVNSILQTRDGYLWVGTRFGLARFDGARFHVFTRENSPLPGNNVQTLAEDGEGNLWLGTGRGLMLYKERPLKVYNHSDGLVGDRVNSLWTSRKGGLWIGTDAGVSFFQGGKFKNFTTQDGLGAVPVNAVYENREGKIFIGHAAGLQQLDPATGKFENLLPETDRAAVVSIYEDREANFWLGLTNGVYRLSQGQVTAFAVPEASEPNVVRCFFQTRDGLLWAGTSETGLTRQVGRRFITTGAETGLAEESILALYEDREGSIWVGTDAGGLNRLQPARVMTYSANNGLVSDKVHSISEGKSGRIWMGTENGYYRVFEINNRPGAATRVRTVDYRGKSIRTVFEDSQGIVWVGGRDTFEQVRDGVVSNLSHFGGYTNRQVHAFHEDAKGNLWFGAENRLQCLKDGKITAYIPTGVPPAYTIRSILEDRNGTLWLGSRDGGVQRFKDGQFTRLLQANGQPTTQGWGLREDADGAIWFGSEAGLNRYKDGRLITLTEREGLLDNMVVEILIDGADNFWLTSNRGIYRVSRKALNDVADGRAKTVRYVLYDESDGMLSSETVGECQPASVRTRDGRLWFPTIKGVVVIDPAKMADNTVLPRVIIEQVIADDHVIHGDDKDEELSSTPHSQGMMLTLPPGRAQVMEIHYTATSLMAPEKVRFQYQLEGYDTEWRDAGGRRVAYYSNLRPGNYRFRVKACNNHGIWNETGTTFAFILQPHFYQTYSFYGGCVAAALLTAMGLHRLRIRQLRNQQEQLVTLVDQRTTDLRKEIGERKQAEEKLQEHRRHLEEEVARRTVELTAANEQLKLDIIARQEAEREKLRMERKLQEAQKLESLGVLAGGVAHDFNNLLTGVLGNAGLVRREIPDHSPLQNKLEQIETASLRAADLAKQMLAYAGKGRLHVQRLDLGLAVRETVQLLQLSIGRKIDLRLELASNLPSVQADATQISQVIMNLVINASEAIGDRAGQIHISTTVQKADLAYLSLANAAPDLPAGDYVCLKVTDTGCGMDRETMARIFDPFFTTKFTGRGLGLAAVQGIVRGHKGALRVESEVGQGATFTLLLPCASEEIPPPPPKESVSGWKGKGTVLVVDDESVVLDVTSSMLESIGFETMRAADGHEALDKFTENPARFTLVLLDLVMPQPDGEEVFREMRRLRPDVRVILMSGFDELDAATRFEGQGLSGFLHKPFKLSALREAARTALQ